MLFDRHRLQQQNDRSEAAGQRLQIRVPQGSLSGRHHPVAGPRRHRRRDEESLLLLVSLLLAARQRRRAAAARLLHRPSLLPRRSDDDGRRRRAETAAGETRVRSRHSEPRIGRRRRRRRWRVRLFSGHLGDRRGSRREPKIPAGEKTDRWTGSGLRLGVSDCSDPEHEILKHNSTTEAVVKMTILDNHELHNEEGNDSQNSTKQRFQFDSRSRTSCNY